MAKTRNPQLFSNYFEIDPELLSQANLIDPFLNTDIQLFIDPLLLEKSKNAIIRSEGVAAFRKRFSDIIRLLTLCKNEGDTAWRAAYEQLDLSEAYANGLGYGSGSRSGSSRPKSVRTAILQTTREIVSLGANDPEMISLMNFIEKGVGPDTLSDFTTNVIFSQLAKITQEFCEANNIAINPYNNYSLPFYKDINEKEIPIILTPLDIVRTLPEAFERAEIEDVVFHNQQLRSSVNRYLGNIAKATVEERKEALKNIALSSSESFTEVLSILKEATTHYDTNKDLLGYFAYKSLLSKMPFQLHSLSSFDFSSDQQAVLKVAREAIQLFKHQIETGNLWEMLWETDNPKKERVGQLLLHAIAISFCRANNIDISPEVNMGGGSIDFKFSKGYQASVVVEVKKSTGTVVAGYSKQLEQYKQAAQTEYGIFVILNVEKMGSKLRQIQQLQTEQIAKGERASEIIVIDASQKQSASKRR